MAALDSATAGQVFVGDTELTPVSSCGGWSGWSRSRSQCWEPCVGLGIVFGVALQRSQAGEGLEVLGIPWIQLVIFVLLAGVVGVLAALWPAYRAARLDVLRAITTE